MDVDPVDFRAWGHQFAHGSLGKPDNALQHLVLFVFDDAAARGFGEQHVQFFGGDGALAGRAHAQQADEDPRGRIEQPHQRRSHFCQQRHRTCHDDGNGRGSAQGDLLGHQLADDKAQIGRHDNHCGEAGLFGPACGNAEQLEALPYRPAEARSGIGACDDPDQRDPDLHGGEELPRLGSQLQRDLGATVALLRGRAQPRGPCRNDGQFAHGENAVEHDQPCDDQQVGPWKRCHPRTASTNVWRCQRFLLFICQPRGTARRLGGLLDCDAGGRVRHHSPGERRLKASDRRPQRRRIL